MVVVGAGPAGTSLALVLARSGLAVTLVEARSNLVRQFRGEALMPSGLDALGAMGLLPLLDTQPRRPLQGWHFIVNGQELFRAAEPLGGDPLRPCTLVSQQALLELLIEQARTFPDFALERGQAAVDLLWRRDQVVGVQLGDGRQLEADLVLACDGRASLLRQKAKLQLIDGTSQVDLLWFQLACPASSPLQGNFITLVGASGVFSAFESAAGGLQLGWVLAAGERAPAQSQSQWVERLAALCPTELADWLRQWGSGLSEPTRLSVKVGLAERWWRPGLLLLGDAAHPMSPVRAQGINMALRDACVASARLVPLLRGNANTAAEALNGALAAIEAERRPEITALQTLQALETARGERLRTRGWLRRGLALAAPLIGPAIAAHWSQQQQPLRHGLSALPQPS
ncbi:MAG: FAD-dependent monooxygenase [Synechococcus sp.]|nr:FAD-dependent monooxygenase [Synechococcus sp.]